MKRVMIVLTTVALACSAVVAATVWPHVRAKAATAFSFAVAGDLGANGNTSAVLNAVASSGSQLFWPMGDLSYSQVTPESAWCDYVHARLGASYPVELLAGNHDDNDGPDGFIGNFASCLPDQIGGVQGTYAEEYYVDYPATAPLVRFIMISPGLDLNANGTNWSYKQGTAHYNWTANAIDSARAAGIPWVVVGMHEYCLSLVNHSCFVSDDLMNLLVSKKVDLYLQAHDHAYSRSKQLALGPGCSAISSTSFNSSCVADANPASSYTAGNGTVIATVGSGGVSINSQDPTLAWAPYFQTYMGSNNNATYGFLKVNVSDSQLSAQFVRGSGGSYTDSFSLTKPLATSSPTPTVTPTPTPTPTSSSTAAQASVRSSATYASTASESSSTVPMPAGWQPGDVVYVGYELTSSTTSITVPPGWVEAVPQFRSASSTSSLSGVLRRVMQAGDPNSLTVSHTSGRFAAISAAIQATDNTTPEDVAPTADNNTGVAFPSVEIPSITPVQQDALLLTFAAIRNGTNGSVTTFTPPTGMTGVAQVSSAVSGTSNAAIEMSYAALSSNAATGIIDATIQTSSGTSANPMGSTIAVRSAGG
ncbi:MAG TPA: metallophosphoesterase [Streptosporangiaceae bacterium]|nr:metallophosphoesterase [Streptosporangiaceae bacterium]